MQVDAALIATGRAPFTKGLGLENVPFWVSYLFLYPKDCLKIKHHDIDVSKLCMNEYIG